MHFLSRKFICKHKRDFSPLKNFNIGTFGRRVKISEDGEGGLVRSLSLSGFTLIELLVVIAIIGLLASIVSAGVRHASSRARDARRLSDMNSIKNGMDIFFSSSQGGFPSKAEFDAAMIGGGSITCDGHQIMKVPQDPQYPNFQYDYEVSGLTYSGCGSTDLSEDYEVHFWLEIDGGATEYTMNSEGAIIPPPPNL